MASVMADDRRTSLKGRRLPGKPSRFDPDQPLHMTTRRAARTRPTDGSHSSFTGSVDGDISRRGSIDGLRPSSSNSGDSPISNQTQQFLLSTNTLVSSKVPEDATQTLATLQSTAGTSQSSFSPDHSSSIAVQSKKRKRSPSPYSIEGTKKTRVPIIVESAVAPTEVPDNKERIALSPSASFATGAAQSVEVPPANESSTSLKVELSFGDATPLESLPISPTSEGSAFDSSIAIQANPNALNASRLSVEDGDNVDGVEETDILNDLDDQPMTDDDGTTIKKRRLGGRRRAAHPIPQVEAAMRRQSELRTSYRNLARLQKGLLVEISSRTIDELKTDSTAHKQVQDFERVTAALERKLQQRLAKVQNDRGQIKSLLDHKLHVGQQLQNIRHSQQVIELQDVFLNRLEHRVLELEREAQALRNSSPTGTEDEDDVVPKLKRVRYRSAREGALATEYDSRSREMLETERMFRKLNARLNMTKALQELDPEGQAQQLAKFTVMDSAVREASAARLAAARDITTLAQAAQQIEAEAAALILPNEQAFGLQLLSNAITRSQEERVTRRSARHLATTQKPATSTSHKQFAASIQPSVQSLLSSEPEPTTTLPMVKSEDSVPFTSPRPSQLVQPPSQMHLHNNSTSLAPHLYAPPASSEPAPFQPLRLPGYPHRQFELAPPGDDNNRERKTVYAPSWPELPRVPSTISDRPLLGRIHESSMSSHFPFLSGPAGIRHDLPMADRRLEDGHPPYMDNTLPRPYPRDLIDPALSDERHGQSQSSSAATVRDAEGPPLPRFSAPPAAKPASNDHTIHAATETTAQAQDKSSFFNKWKSRDDRNPRARKSARDEKKDSSKRHGHSLSSTGLGATKLSPISFPENNLDKHDRRPSWDSAALLASLTPSLARPSSQIYPPAPGYNMPPHLPLPGYFPFRPMSFDFSPAHHRNSIPPPLGLNNWGSPSDPNRPLYHPGGEPAGGPWPMPPPYNHEPPSSMPPGSNAASAALGHAYGGQPLAPAYEDPRRRPQGFGGVLPAFAQQQRNVEGTRRRAQSEAQQPKIHQWTPSGSKRI